MVEATINDHETTKGGQENSPLIIIINFNFSSKMSQSGLRDGLANVYDSVLSEKCRWQRFLRHLQYVHKNKSETASHAHGNSHLSRIIRLHKILADFELNTVYISPPHSKSPPPNQAVALKSRNPDHYIEEREGT